MLIVMDAAASAEDVAPRRRDGHEPRPPGASHPGRPAHGDRHHGQPRHGRARARSRTCPASPRSSRSRRRTSSSRGRPSARTRSSRSAACPIGGKRLAVVAGPCAVESRGAGGRDRPARARTAGATHYRGGAFKPRTSPYSFQGLGREGPRRSSRACAPRRGCRSSPRCSTPRPSTSSPSTPTACRSARATCRTSRC